MPVRRGYLQQSRWHQLIHTGRAKGREIEVYGSIDKHDPQSLKVAKLSGSPFFEERNIELWAVYSDCNFKQHNVLYATYVVNESLDEANYVVIDDVQIEDSNEGIGSIFLSVLKNIALEKGAQSIKGVLSGVDRDRFDQLEHFYKKNDFTVHFNTDRSKGGVRFNISETG